MNIRDFEKGEDSVIGFMYRYRDRIDDKESKAIITFILRDYRNQNR